MNAEDRYILVNSVSYVDMTHDIYFACQEGWITPSELYNVQEESSKRKQSYESVLSEVFEKWYMEKATPEQQFLVDLNGFISLNDQFDDLQTIIAKDVEDYLLTDFDKAEIENEEERFKQELREMLDEGKTGIFNKLTSAADSPIKTRKDLNDLPNMVYLLNHSNKSDWAKSVNSILFRLKHNHYNGLNIEQAFDWLIHSRQLKAIEYKRAIENAYSSMNEEDYVDSSEEDNKQSFIGNVLNLKKHKEENYAKKAIKRGLKTLSSLLSPREVSLFSSGDGFIVESKIFNYRLRKSGISMINQTMNPISNHIPYDLIVMNKDNVELCNLCIYFDETPVIDQVIATVMHLKFEEGELNILKTGNFFKKTDAFYDDKSMNAFLNNEPMPSYEIDDAEDLSEFSEVDQKTKEARRIKYHEAIRKSVFDALPNFIGAELPRLVYSDFHNLVFDDILSQYQMAELEEEKVVSPLIYQALESL